MTAPSQLFPAPFLTTHSEATARLLALTLQRLKPRVMSMTMGQLAVDYANMQQQNHSDSVIAKALKAVNRDRVRVAHKKRTPAAERALRNNVGQQMWTIVGALRVLYP
jgi:hypothetical protein